MTTYWAGVATSDDAPIDPGLDHLHGVVDHCGDGGVVQHRARLTAARTHVTRLVVREEY